MKFKTKLCGLTRAQDINLAIHAGFSAVGMIHYSRSPRHLELPQMIELKKQLEAQAQLFLVVVDQPIDTLLNLIEILQPDAVQLHGSESPAYLQELCKRKLSTKIVKAIRVGHDGITHQCQHLEDLVDCFLFDTYHKDQIGGTGQRFDWNLVKSIKISKPYILSGGLGPQNLNQLIQVAHDWSKLPIALDFNSKLEISPGIKCSKAIRQVIHEMQNLDVFHQSAILT